MGRVGVGKSTLAGSLGETLGWEVVSSDKVRKEQAGLPLYERASPDIRTSLYTPERTEAVYTALRKRAVDRALLGAGTVLDATYGRRSEREALRRALPVLVPVYFLEVVANDAVVQRRLKARSFDSGVVSDARLEDMASLGARYESPETGESDRIMQIECEAPIENVVEDALLKLLRPYK
jgi:uncharacterized protein